MSDNMKVTSKGLRTTAGHLDDMADKFATVRDRLVASNTEHWGKWGTDDFGKTFEGDKGYIPSHENLMDNLNGKIDLLQNYSDGLNESADELDRAELANYEDLEGI
ncbi:hypothetical protein [Nocardia australiensis]|uniref:hypothetical protein n=1 Tax=Nocardia australiensis TaxID=2887191 RepID=UPI001D1540CB|nr:hypothetical protein [Nocardia australiensis]